MKEPQRSLQPVLQRWSEFRASPHLHLPSKINHKPQSISKRYSLYYFLYPEKSLHLHGWNAFEAILIFTYHPTGWSIVLLILKQRHHTLISPLCWTEENSSEHIRTVDIHILVRWNLACHKAAPSFPRQTLNLCCSSIREWKVISKLTYVKAVL